MNTISLTPDDKLKRKSFYILLTVFFFIFILGIILQITIPLGGKIDHLNLLVILWPIIIGTCLIAAIVSIPLIILWIKNLSYSIEEERITIRKGFLTKIQQNIPYRAITDFMLHRSLYDRLLKIGSIRIQTAGQSATPTGYEANMAGLIELESLMTELQGRVKKHHMQSEINSEDSEGNKDDTLISILKEVAEIKNLLKNR